MFGRTAVQDIKNFWVGVVRELMTKWKSKIGVVSGVISSTAVGVWRIRTFPFLPIPFTTPSLMIQWKLGCRSRKQKRKNQPIARSGVEHCHWFILPLLLATPTMQFSLDHKRRSHKQNQCSASHSVGSIFAGASASTMLPSAREDRQKSSKEQREREVQRQRERQQNSVITEGV